MVFSDTIHVMLLTHDKYRQFTSKKIADAKATSQVLICLSADSRAAVDDMVAKAQGAGGGADIVAELRLDQDHHRGRRLDPALGLVGACARHAVLLGGQMP